MSKATRKLIVRQLPASEYALLAVHYEPAGISCENCGRLIHYVGLVSEQVTGMEFRIGMDCAQTLCDATSFERYNALISQVKSVQAAITAYERLRRTDERIVAHDKRVGAVLSAAYHAKYQSVLVSVPGIPFGRAKAFSILPENWLRLFHPVIEQLASHHITNPYTPLSDA